MITDGYSQYYADRLWSLIPPVYRGLDAGPAPTTPGPLRELVNRIASQAAVVRRNIDRLGENQSIETCDDWVIPYLGDLVATRLLACLHPAAQRADVARTIYYRRRAGTVGVLEELAADIASRDARVVEFFRRMARTRHQFDPPLSYRIEDPITGPIAFTGTTLEIAEGLLGPYSGTPAGGFADLRNNYAASNTNSAFDEYAHTADLRTGYQTLGHFNIRHLGVFLWWLQAFPILAATPVASASTPPCFTFDPTGREIPLFAPSQRALEQQAFGEHWVTPDEWELPVAIRETLWRTVPSQLYPHAFSVGLEAGGTSAPVPPNQLTIHPETGRFSFPAGAPIGDITASYSFGLLSPIGAGGFDTSILTTLPMPTAITPISGGHATDLNPTLATLPANTILQFTDSLTYTGPTQTLTIPTGSTTVLRGQSGQRPVLRWTSAPTPSWIITAPTGTAGTPTILILEAILLQGADLILQGNFDSVYLRMVTLDPGSPALPTAAPGTFFATANDTLPLRPTTLWIEGSVTTLTLERSITGPICTRNGGAIQQLLATDSIVQSIPTHAVPTTGTLTSPTLFDPASLASSLKFQSNPLAKTAVTDNPALAAALADYPPNTTPSSTLLDLILTALAPLTPSQAESSWPLAFADLALAFSEGAVYLSRTTVLGPTYTHALSASESILDDIATVEDAQTGCIRFSAYAAGSTLHQPFRSVQIVPRASIFRSRSFGQPEYVRLRDDADLRILTSGSPGACACASPGSGSSILTGAQNGSEMGVYCLEAVPLKHRGFALKFEEYAPIGQLPVWIDAD